MQMKRHVNRELIAVITVLGVGSLAMAIPGPILPLYLTSIGITPAVLGLIQSVIMVGMVIGEPSMGWLADRIGMKILLSIGTFFYDGDGNRVVKIEGGETVIYVNQYYEVDITTGSERRDGDDTLLSLVQCVLIVHIVFLRTNCRCGY